nr:hypothetical protein CFP56_37214 [Quercus suber]
MHVVLAEGECVQLACIDCVCLLRDMVTLCLSSWSPTARPRRRPWLRSILSNGHICLMNTIQHCLPLLRPIKRKHSNMLHEFSRGLQSERTWLMWRQDSNCALQSSTCECRTLPTRPHRRVCKEPTTAPFPATTCDLTVYHTYRAT